MEIYHGQSVKQTNKKWKTKMHRRFYLSRRSNRTGKKKREREWESKGDRIIRAAQFAGVGKSE